MKKYLSLDYTKGQFFEYSKEEIPGYEKHTGKEGKVSYRNYFLKGVRGVFKGVKFEDGNFGEQIRVGLEDNGVMYLLSMGTSNSNGYEDDFFIPLMQVLPGMKMGEIYLINPFRFTPKDSKYEKKGFSIKDVNDENVNRVVTQAYYKGQGADRVLIAGDIPPLEFEQDRKEKWTVEPVSLKNRNKVIDDLIIGLEKTHPADFGAGITGYNVTTADVSQPRVATPVAQAETVRPVIAVDNSAPVANAEKPAETKKAAVKNDDLPF